MFDQIRTLTKQGGFMRSPKPQKEKEAAFKMGTNLLAKTAAVGVTFFVTGPFYAATDASIRSFVANAYAVELVGIASLAWFAIVGISVFAFATLAIAAIVQVGGVNFSRFFTKFK